MPRIRKVSVGVTAKYVAQAERAGLTWPLPENRDEAALARLLGKANDVPARLSRYAAPDGAAILQELRKKGGTLAVPVGGIPGAQPRTQLPLCPVLRALLRTISDFLPIRNFGTYQRNAVLVT